MYFSIEDDMQALWLSVQFQCSFIGIRWTFALKWDVLQNVTVKMDKNKLLVLNIRKNTQV